jgi:hypothetical protein
MSITPALRHEPVSVRQNALNATPESVRIIAEIAERLEELEEAKKGHAWDLVVRLAGIAYVSPKLFEVVIACMHGRTECIAYSYNVQADRRGLTKQAIHTEYKVHMKHLERMFPELTEAIEAIRVAALAHEDRMSHEDALREARGED